MSWQLAAKIDLIYWSFLLFQMLVIGQRNCPLSLAFSTRHHFHSLFFKQLSINCIDFRIRNPLPKELTRVTISVPCMLVWSKQFNNFREAKNMCTRPSCFTSQYSASNQCQTINEWNRVQSTLAVMDFPVYTNSRHGTEEIKNTGQKYIALQLQNT